MANLKNNKKLLSDISFQLNTKHFNMCRLQSLGVRFSKGKDLLKEGDLIWALDCLSNDLYWDQESNWSEADTAELFVF